MNTRYFFVFLSITTFVLGAFATVSFAQSTISYPISELGSCKDKQSCKAYCDKAENMPACISYAEKQGLLSGEELRIAKIVAEKVASKQTPGGCTSKESCESYCNGNVEHLNACLSFGEELGVIPKTELEEAKKIASALGKGASMPGSCKTKGECEQYCAVGSHIDECLNFAEASGILSIEELAEARKVAPFIQSGETPGKCTTKSSCESYCKEDDNFTECLGFAEKVGFVSAEDAAIARKTGGKGPGGCKSKDSCEAYCNEDANAAECATFAKEKGLLTKEQEELVNNGMDKLRDGLNQIPDEARLEVMSCLEKAVGGKEKLDRLLSKKDVPTRAMGDKIQSCFSNINEIMQRVMTEKYTQQGGASGGVSVPSVPPAAGGPPPGSVGAPQTPGQNMANPGSETCSAFANAPSCDYVPAGQARDLCKKCKQ